MLQVMSNLDRRIKDGTLWVDDEGHIVSKRPDGSVTRIGHEANLRGNVRLTYRDDDGKVVSVQAQRVAWRIHHGFWPPDDMSVMMVNGDKHDFRRENLMLVPSGQENRAKKTMRRKTA